MLIPLWKWLTLGVATEFFPTSIWWWSGVTWRFPRGKSYFYHRFFKVGVWTQTLQWLGSNLLENKKMKRAANRQAVFYWQCLIGAQVALTILQQASMGSHMDFVGKPSDSSGSFVKTRAEDHFCKNRHTSSAGASRGRKFQIWNAYSL